MRARSLPPDDAAIDGRSRLWFLGSASIGLTLAAVDAAIAFAVRALLSESLGWLAAMGSLVALVVLRGILNLAMMGTSHLGREAYAAILRRSTLAWLLDASRDQSRAVGVARDLVELHPRALVHVQMRAAVAAQLSQVAVLAIAAMILAPTIAPVALGALAIVAVGVFSMGRALQRRALVALGAHQAFLADVQRIVTTMPVLRALRLEAQELGRAEALIGNHARHARRSAMLTAVAAAAPTIAGAPVLALVLSAALMGGATPASAVALVLVLVRLVLVASSAASTWSTARATADAHRRATDRIAGARRAGHRAARERGGLPGISIQDLVVHVDGRPLVDGLSVRVAPGEHLAILGATGAGKSTLVEVILGLRPPEGGLVELGGSSPTDYVEQTTIGYLPPTPCLFAGTLRENLSLGHERPDDAELASAMHQALAGPLLEREGLDLVLGEGGSPLSSGERQRVALARALVGSPALLVLDEPTAHVDAETASAIQSWIRSRVSQTTCVVTSHQRAAVEHCSHFIELTR